MRELVDKYAAKLVTAGLAEEGAPLLGGLDAELAWSREDPLCAELERVFAGLNINALLFSRPAEPYRSIIGYLADRADDCIEPEDSETRTFMHDLPVIASFNAGRIVEKLRCRKSVIVKGQGIVTWGMVSPEQAFIFYSSLCFACFVKFFSDYLAAAQAGEISAEQRTVFDTACTALEHLPDTAPALMTAPFGSEDDVYRAVSEAGRATVEHRLVDSFFGNVSYRRGNTLYISQTSSSLDELEGCIDPCPLDGSSCVGITASSELTAHREVVLRTGSNAILHGHPKFTVILSMLCDKEGCDHRGRCHTRCPEERFIDDIPIVPGEVGTGPYGLCNTLPQAMEGRRGVIVYGHGLFTVAKDDFNEAFATLLDVERLCRDRYFSTVRKAHQTVGREYEDEDEGRGRCKKGRA